MKLYDTSELFEMLRKGEPVSGYILDLTIYEFINVVWKHVRRGTIDREEGLDLIESFLEQDIDVIRVDQEDGKEILSLALGTGLTVYDAAYVFYAKKYGLELRTRDEKLRKTWQKEGMRWTL